jgi:hypothetical protein
MATGTLDGTLQFAGEMRPGSGSVVNDTVSASADIARSKLGQDTEAVYVIPFYLMRVHDAIQTVLPSPSATDDLGFPATQTLGTVSPLLETHDLKQTTTTCYARFSFQLPAEYDNGQTVKCRIRCGMKTTVSDDTATIDLEVYEADRDGGAGADICATAAQDMNNLANADKEFTITATDLISGDVLDCRIAVAVVDAATGTAVIGEVLEVAFLLDIRG